MGGQVIAPGVLNIEVEPHDGPQESSFFLPKPMPGGIKVMMFGGWTKEDALAAHILASANVEYPVLTIGNRDPDALPVFDIPAESIRRARGLARSILNAFAPEPDPAAPPDPKLLVIQTGEEC